MGSMTTDLVMATTGENFPSVILLRMGIDRDHLLRHSRQRDFFVRVLRQVETDLRMAIDRAHRTNIARRMYVFSPALQIWSAKHASAHFYRPYRGPWQAMAGAQ